jgi:mono/diheme cytochrome c family protein
VKKILKWAGIALGGLVGVLVLAAAVIYVLAGFAMNRTYDVPTETVAIPTDAESIAYGKHVAEIRFCTACHGDDLAGQIEFQDPMVGIIANANLTSGQGGIGGAYTDADWVRSIRHGVGPDGGPLLIMPAQTFNTLSDRDLGAVIAYVKSVPPVDRQSPGVHFGLLPRALFLFGQLDLAVPAAQIDHNAARPPDAEPGVTAEYGEYLTRQCVLCHGQGFSGGTTPLAGPSDPPALNLTPAGELAGWSFEDFKTALRTGVTPAGRELRAEFMPWPTIGKMTDDELEAIWLYLQTVPPRDFGNH